MKANNKSQKKTLMKIIITGVILLLAAAIFTLPAAAAMIAIDQSSSSSSSPQGGIIKISGSAQGIATLNVLIYQKYYSTITDIETIIIPVTDEDTFTAFIETAELPAGEYYVTISPEQFEGTRYSVDLSQSTKFIVKDPIPGLIPTKTPEPTVEPTPEKTQTPAPQSPVPLFGIAAGLFAAAVFLKRK